MPTAEARIHTARPSRYLVQLGKHFANKGRHLGHRPRPHHGGNVTASAETHMPPDIQPHQIHVEYSDAQGVLRLPWGRCTMDAEPDALVLRAEADNEEGLRRLQDLLAAHIGRFGRREELRVEWRRLETTSAAWPTEETATARSLQQPAPARRRHLTWVGIATLAILVVAIHLGAADALLSAPRWTGWAVWGVMAAVVLKVTVLSVWGRRGHRRRRRQVG